MQSERASRRAKSLLSNDFRQPAILLPRTPVCNIRNPRRTARSYVHTRAKNSSPQPAIFGPLTLQLTPPTTEPFIVIHAYSFGRAMLLLSRTRTYGFTGASPSHIAQ